VQFDLFLSELEKQPYAARPEFELTKLMMYPRPQNYSAKTLWIIVGSDLEIFLALPEPIKGRTQESTPRRTFQSRLFGLLRLVIVLVSVISIPLARGLLSNPVEDNSDDVGSDPL
jgi:hypothetical protein